MGSQEGTTGIRTPTGREDNVTVQSLAPEDKDSMLTLGWDILSTSRPHSFMSSLSKPAREWDPVGPTHT